MAEPTVEEKARSQGWRPKEEFNGDETKFVDAETFVRRGEEVLPFVKANNRKLQETVESQATRLEQLERTNRANAAALEAIQESNREQVAERAEETVENIEAQIVAAREGGDVQAELALLRQHATAVGAVAKAKEKPVIVQQQQQADPSKDPVFQSFLRDNPWWNADPVMRAASIEIQNQLVVEGKVTAATSATDRLAMVAEATRVKFGIKDNGRRGGANRVEGGGGPGAGGAGTGGSGKTYADLPDDAKVACDKAGRRLKIGKGQKFETADDWRKSYVSTYFSH